MVPPRPVREVRDLLRYRTKLVAMLASEKNRLQKHLADANIKLGSVASSILGKSARARLAEIIDGVPGGGGELAPTCRRMRSIAAGVVSTAIALSRSQHRAQARAWRSARPP